MTISKLERGEKDTRTVVGILYLLFINCFIDLS